VLQHHKDPKRK